MPIRRTVETCVAQDPDGVWRRREVPIVARYRLRVVSDRSGARPHQQGVGEDFEVAIDTQLEAWVRKFGSDGAFRREEDAAGVGLRVVENVTSGIRHETTLSTRPSDPLVRWSCSCGTGARVWLERPVAERQRDEHVTQATERDRVAAERGQQWLAQRRQSE